MAYREISDESREKMRQAKLGRRLPKSTREKIGEASKGRPGPEHSQETLEGFRGYTEETVRSFKRLLRQGEPVNTAAKKLGISRATARRIASGESYIGVGDD